ncbi:hypothetical protein [Nitrosomonas aestuarii]|uniref:hypothetical protein n=1 Tax=Nitrosomonas aestuarii TaxID=52441 RepID=UPI000B818407|nr:hypothetical protein [Nitrosomonas aestuarii]
MLDKHSRKTEKVDIAPDRIGEVIFNNRVPSSAQMAQYKNEHGHKRLLGARTHNQHNRELRPFPETCQT